MVQVFLMSPRKRDSHDGKGYQQHVILQRQILALQNLSYPAQDGLGFFSFNHIIQVSLEQTSAKCNWYAQGPWHSQKHALMTQVKTKIYCGYVSCNTNSYLLPSKKVYLKF